MYIKNNGPTCPADTFITADVTGFKQASPADIIMGFTIEKIETGRKGYVYILSLPELARKDRKKVRVI